VRYSAVGVSVNSTEMKNRSDKLEDGVDRLVAQANVSHRTTSGSVLLHVIHPFNVEMGLKWG